MPRRKEPQDNSQPPAAEQEELKQELEALEDEFDEEDDDGFDDADDGVEVEVEDGEDEPVAPVMAAPRRAAAPKAAPKSAPAEPARALGRSLTITLDADKFEALAKEARALGLDTGTLARVFILNGLRSQQGLGRDAGPVRPERGPTGSAGFAPRTRERDGGPRRQEEFAPRGGRERGYEDRPPRDDRGGWNRGGGGGSWDRGPARGPSGGPRRGEPGGGGSPRGGGWGGYKDQPPRREREWEDRGPGGPGGFRPRPRRDER